MTEKTDGELLHDFQRGDEAAFNILVRRYQERIYWIARRFVVDHDDADDIVQDVFSKAYSALKDFRGDSRIYTWLYRIAVNFSLNALRRKKVHEFLHLDDLFQNPDTQAGRPDEAMEQQEERRLIEEAVAVLPQKQKAVFLMRYHDEMPYEEIAAILGTSVGGLKANYFHAVKKIESYLRKAHATRTP
jgi:RNA polymerase sigma factor (sigma-70 family)